uniref:KAP NTPase domain-containing protein n=1 Tax=Ditylenchus dipsaci TaxID=166011 RepID=A0A915EF87_9BILA
MVDGLDSCEQSKMLQILDALTLFFCSRQNAPFIVVLAVDPHIITSGIQHSLRAGGGGANEITGQEYLKNIVTMPFFLDHAALKQLQASRHKSVPFNHNASFKEGNGRRLFEDPVSSEVGNLLPSYDYFSNISPRIMRRIVNSIALTGRLLRTFEVEFSWFMLYTWISLVEQWPICQHDSNRILQPNKDIYNYGQQLGSQPCRIRADSSQNLQSVNNLDPHLRKVIYEQHSKKEDDEEEYVEEENTVEDSCHLAALKSIGAAEFLFDDPNVWANISKPLVKMPISDVSFLVAKLNIPGDRLKSCELEDLKFILKAYGLLDRAKSLECHLVFKAWEAKACPDRVQKKVRKTC